VNRHFIFAILAAALAATVACGQWIESIIHLPDSLSGTDGVYWLEFDSLNNTVYAAGYPGTAVIDATSHNKIALLPFWARGSVWTLPTASCTSAATASMCSMQGPAPCCIPFR